MNLPTKTQVDTAARYATAIAGTAFAIFGLQAKGISLDQVKAVIAALGDVANNVIILLATIAPLYVAGRGIKTSSPTGQATAIGANAATNVQPAPGGMATVTITDPEMASAALAAQKSA